MKGKRGITPQFWMEYRVYYREIVNLINMADIAIAKIILISISNNLFFICVQLLRSLEWVSLSLRGWFVVMIQSDLVGAVR